MNELEEKELLRSRGSYRGLDFLINYLKQQVTGLYISVFPNDGAGNGAGTVLN
jgi:hypothetical protein